MKDLASNVEWRKWGETDPLYAVASWGGKQKNGPDAWTDEDFYKLGESDWKDFRKHWEAYGLNKETCLEIGCGAGRITAQLASYFDNVHALDVSDKMIDYARKHCKPSVIFHVSNGVDIPLNSESITSCFSTHVFQHFDCLSVGRRYFAEIARVLKPDGTLMVHLPVYQWPPLSRGFNFLHTVQKRIQDIKAMARRTLMRLDIDRPIMRALGYPVNFFYDELPRFGFDDIEISIFMTRSNADPHPFVFAKKKR
jgi:SAM-dependent methyltransferase